MYIKGEINQEIRFPSTIVKNELILSCLFKVDAENIVLYTLNTVQDYIVKSFYLKIYLIGFGKHRYKEGSPNGGRLLDFLVECLHIHKIIPQMLLPLG